MSVRVELAAHYRELYGVGAADIAAPKAGESVREYIQRAGLGKEENILPVVGGKSKPFDYRLQEGDVLVIYPMAASG